MSKGVIDKDGERERERDPTLGGGNLYYANDDFTILVPERWRSPSVQDAVDYCVSVSD